MKLLENIFGVVFDMDGLLIDSENLWLTIAAMVEKDMGINLGKAIKESVGRRDDETIEAFTQILGSKLLVDEFYERYNQKFKEYMDLKGMPVKAGASDILRYFKGKGYKMALASSSARWKVVERLQFANISQEYFDVIICGDEVTHAKPDPEIYLKACKALNLEPNQIVAIEDSAMGIEAGYRAGCHVIAVPDILPINEHTRPMIVAECKTLFDVIGLFG